MTFVEWADRVAYCIPADCLEIRCEVIGETSRRYTITPRTERDDQMIAAIREATG